MNQTDLERLAHTETTSAESPRVQRHLFDCDACLRRLIDIHARLAPIASEFKRMTSGARTHAAGCHA